MDKFICCLCDDDLTALISSGSVSASKLQEQWALILAEYYELKGDTVNGIELLKISRDVKRTYQHLNIVDICVTFLSERYSESIAESLRRLGYPFKPASTNPDDYRNELQVIINKSKTKYVQLQQLLKDLQNTVEKYKDAHPKREHFEEALILIEEVQKVPYAMNALTVTKFVSLEKLVAKKLERQAKSK